MVHSLTITICYLDSVRYKIIWSQAQVFSSFLSREKRVFVERNTAEDSPKWITDLFAEFSRCNQNTLTSSVGIWGMTYRRSKEDLHWCSLTASFLVLKSLKSHIATPTYRQNEDSRLGFLWLTRVTRTRKYAEYLFPAVGKIMMAQGLRKYGSRLGTDVNASKWSVYMYLRDMFALKLFRDCSLHSVPLVGSLRFTLTVNRILLCYWLWHVFRVKNKCVGNSYHTNWIVK